MLKAHWAPSCDALPVQTADVHANFFGFLSDVVQWMTMRKWTKKNALAMHVIWTGPASKVFGGVGKYIVNEAFARAGMQISLF